MSRSPEHGPLPLEQWSQDIAMRALSQFAYDLGHATADEAWRRLDRLTAEQRAWVCAQIRDWDPPELRREPGRE